METNRLKQFKVVAETQNLRKAAEILNLSHSALSKSLKVLSLQLGRELLIQKGRNIQLTKEGLGLLGKIDEVLAAENRLLSKGQEAESRIRIGTFEVFSTHLLGNCWHKYFSNELLELREMLPGDLESAIASEVIDIGITYEPIATAGVDFVYMGEVDMGIYGRRKNFEKTAFHQLPFVKPISPVVGTPSGMKGLDGWPDHQFPRYAKFCVDTMETGLALARSGSAVIFAADFVVKHHNQSLDKDFKIELIEPPKGLKRVRRKIFLITRKNELENLVIRKIAKLIRNECL